MSCAVCFDEMDMQEFNDPRERTETCFKMECGHAYHTTCLVQYLSRTNHQCLHCNQQQTPAAELGRDGLKARLLAAVNRIPEVRAVNQERLEAVSEYRETIAGLRKEFRDFVHKRIEESKLHEKRAYWFSTERALKRAQLEAANKISNQHVGSLQIGTRRRSMFHWAEWRLRHPRFSIAL